MKYVYRFKAKGKYVAHRNGKLVQLPADNGRLPSKVEVYARMIGSYLQENVTICKQQASEAVPASKIWAVY